MGRTNLVILCLGLFACVALSLMMKYAVQVKTREPVHPAVAELFQVFSEQLQERPTFAIESREGRKVGVLTILPSPLISTNEVPKLANSLGKYLDRFRGQDLTYESLVVVAKSAKGGTPRSFDVSLKSSGIFRTGWRNRPQSTRAARPPTPAPAPRDKATVPATPPRSKR